MWKAEMILVLVVILVVIAMACLLFTDSAKGSAPETIIMTKGDWPAYCVCYPGWPSGWWLKECRGGGWKAGEQAKWKGCY